MPPTAPSHHLEQALRTLPQHGTLVKDRGYRQVWRFELEGRAYYLKFYPKGGGRDRFRRFFRGSPALREFARLQALQKANVPAPRAVAAMLGFTINSRQGDAVILNAVEPSLPLDQYLSDLELRGERVPDHLALGGQVYALVALLGKAKLGHEDLHLGNFLMHEGKLMLLDGYAVRTDGLRMRDILMLAHSAGRFATRTDLLRGWDILGPGGRLPGRNPVTVFLRGRFMESIFRENRYFGRIKSAGFSGVFYKHTKYPHRWSVVSRLAVNAEDWNREWPMLLQRIESDQLEIIKRSRSGDVLGGQIIIGGRPVEIVVKRPRRRYWYRYVNEIGRGSRARRAWKKAWNLLSRGLPVAWPLLLMEQRTAGYVTDAFFICERIPGKTLNWIDLDALSAKDRDSLFHRTGTILRQIEADGFSHFDAKASNWIAYADDRLGTMPVMIDVDGVRKRRWVALGIKRLLRSMHDNPKYTPADSLSLCRGYAPFARLENQTVPESADAS